MLSKPPALFNLVGPLCDDIGMDCLGDTQDASYQFRPGFLCEDRVVYVLIGTLGTKTKNATYVSLGLNNTKLRLGADNIDDVRLEGSTAAYSGVGNLDKFFIYYISQGTQRGPDSTLLLSSVVLPLQPPAP